MAKLTANNDNEILSKLAAEAKNEAGSTGNANAEANNNVNITNDTKTILSNIIRKKIESNFTNENITKCITLS